MAYRKTPPICTAVAKMAVPINILFRAAFFVFLAVLCISCVTTDPYIPIDTLVAEENFPESVETLEGMRSRIYRAKDSVLYYLDKGMLMHYVGNYEESSSLLQQGERAIEENFAVSISQEIGSYILNDRTREYDGEDYEDIYLNCFNALNYYHRGNMEGAMVEIRRMNNKLRDLSVKYGHIMSTMQRMALENETEIPPNPEAPSKFNNSALARYLGMLFYRGMGMSDDARIDQNQLRIAMADAPLIYKNPEPSSIRDELLIPQGMARLNVIGFTGMSPIKTEEVLRIFLGNAWIKIALPVMTRRPSRVTAIEVVLDSGEMFTLELLEDISAVVEATFAQKKNVIYVKSVIRASTKGIAASVLGSAAESSEENKSLFSILSIGTQILAEASEKADLRVARYFPGKAFVGGINLLPGTYSYTVTFYGRRREVITERRFEDIIIRINALNLTEVICLK